MTILLEHLIEVLSSRFFVLFIPVDQDGSHNKLVEASQVISAARLLLSAVLLRLMSFFILLLIVVDQFFAHLG